MRIDELDTPVPVVDIDRLEANIAHLQAYLDQHGIANRPHIKTHKIPEIAKMQMDAGAIGITCQKLSEAEVMADAGFKNIFVPYNIVGLRKLDRLVALLRRATVSVTADSSVVIHGLSTAVSLAHLKLTVLVECDTGLHRCGVQSPREAAQLARLIHNTSSLHFGGLMTYPTSDAMDAFIKETRALLDQDNIPIERVSGGGSPTMWQSHLHPDVTEHRAGIYVYGDRLTLRAGAVTLDQCALRVFATVVSKPTPERGILDAGSKSLSSDLHGLDGYGYICEYPDAKLYALSEEHGHVDFSACQRKPNIGDRVSIIPNHCCTVTAMFDEVVGVRGDQVEVVWKVAARNAVR